MLGLAAADVFGDQVERGGGHIEEIRARKGDLDKIALRAVDRHALDAHKAADAVVLVHHEVAGRQIGVEMCIRDRCGDDAFRGRLLLNAGSTPYLSLRLNKGCLLYTSRCV